MRRVIRDSIGFGAIARGLAVAGVCGVMVLPLAWALGASLKPLEGVYEFPPRFVPDAAQWSNYPDAWTRLPLGRFLVNSLLISGAAMVGAVLTSSMAGFALARLSPGGARVLLLLIGASIVVPGAVLIVPRYLLFDQLGWVNTYKPLIVPAWLGGGAFNILLFRQFFRTIPKSFDDAARLDGATPWQAYRLVILPMARPATVTALLLSFVFHWQEFLDPLLYLSEFEAYPVSLGLRMYQSLSGTWANLLMAASLTALVPVVLLFILCERFLMRGLGVLGRRGSEVEF